MKAVAGRYGAVLVDGPNAVRAAGLTGNAALQDPVHPTAAGQKALAQSIVTALRQAGW
jgi:lysophospholipase L1-like esterase